MTEPADAELAVVIVNFNTRGYLERCLATLQTHRGDVETDVLVIDNASRDGSHLRAHAAHPWSRLIENSRNIYLSPAWNQGIRETSAPYVLFLNPDVEWHEGTLADYVDVARRHPEAGILGPAIRNTDGSMYPSGRPLPSVLDAVGHAFLGPFLPDNPFTRRYHMEGWDRSTERTVDWVSGACMLIPRAALEAVGTFDEAFPLFAEELDMATRMRNDGWSVVFTPEVEIVHAIGISRRNSRRMSRMHSASILRYYRKHRAAGWRKVTVPLAWVALTLRAEIDSLKGRFVHR